MPKTSANKTTPNPKHRLKIIGNQLKEFDESRDVLINPEATLYHMGRSLRFYSNNGEETYLTMTNSSSQTQTIIYSFEQF
jgi:hypothetical protein